MEMSHSYVSFLKDIQLVFQSSGLQTKVVSGFKPSRASITWDECISHKATALGTGDLFIHWGFILQIGDSIYVYIYTYLYICVPSLLYLIRDTTKNDLEGRNDRSKQQ